VWGRIKKGVCVCVIRGGSVISGSGRSGVNGVGVWEYSSARVVIRVVCQVIHGR
jgi:hypothetical protein